jgi:ATP-dependent Clp protease ATP-binding subunit ClpA
MFERFTDRARRAVVLAQNEARLLNHNFIGTEHLLLGLIAERDGVAAKALESLGISLAAVRQQVEEVVGQGQQVIVELHGHPGRDLIGEGSRPGRRARARPANSSGCRPS